MKADNSTAQIKCASDSYVSFNQSQCIRITNIEFIGCGGNLVNHVEKLVIEDTKFEGQENSGTALELGDTIAEIVDSIFTSNSKGSYRHCPVYLVPTLHSCLASGFIGGAIIATNSTINISHSIFQDNKAADYGGAIFAKQKSIIHMSNNIFINNAASVGGALFPYDSTVTINASIFLNNAASTSGGIPSPYYNISVPSQ